jgi:predicted lipoprotein with Yx(FWY)xxD motif
MVLKSIRYCVGVFIFAGTSLSLAATATIPLKSNPSYYLTTLTGDLVFTCNADVPKSTTRKCHVSGDSEWVPLLATESDTPSKEFGIAKLDDGQLHWTYLGRPIYSTASAPGAPHPWRRKGHKAIFRSGGGI